MPKDADEQHSNSKVEGTHNSHIKTWLVNNTTKRRFEEHAAQTIFVGSGTGQMQMKANRGWQRAGGGGGPQVLRQLLPFLSF